MDMRFGTWNVRSLHRTAAVKTVVREFGKYRLDLVGVQEVRWEKGERIIHFSMEKGMGSISQGPVFSYIRESYQRIEK
jgi:exonuclease III